SSCSRSSKGSTTARWARSWAAARARLSLSSIAHSAHCGASCTQRTSTEMAFRRYESIVAECLEAMREGASVESCLVRYPQQMERLRPALMLAERLSKTPAAAARPQAKDQSWRKLERRLAELQSGKQPVKFVP